MHLSIPKIPEPLIIWEKIEILTSTDDNAGLYVARIEDFINDGLVITHPELLKGDVLLRDKCEVILHVTKKDAIYRFQTTILKLQDNAKVKYILTTPKFIQRIQRREFARLVYSTPVEYTVFTERYTPKQQWHRSYSWDISGNGILIETKDFVKDNALILLKIQLFEDLQIPLPILGRSYRTMLDNHIRLSGIGFILDSEFSGYQKNYPLNHISNIKDNFTKSSQEKLVSFVFNQELSQRKKGLL